MTRSLQLMRDWLVEWGATIAAMESTSTYWKGAFYCLEGVMEVWLVNAAHIRAISRRKTDVKDAEWIAQLLEVGLLRLHRQSHGLRSDLLSMMTLLSHAPNSTMLAVFDLRVHTTICAFSSQSRGMCDHQPASILAFS